MMIIGKQTDVYRSTIHLPFSHRNRNDTKAAPNLKQPSLNKTNTHLKIMQQQYKNIKQINVAPTRNPDIINHSSPDNSVGLCGPSPYNKNNS